MNVDDFEIEEMLLYYDEPLIFVAQFMERKCLWLLASGSGVVTYVVVSTDDAAVEVLKNNGTNLLDAIGGVMVDVDSMLRRTPESDRDAVIMAILTDGEENSSRHYKSEDVKTMVARAETANWGFLFLGANIDAFSTGMNLGFRADNTLQFNTSKIDCAASATSRGINSMKAAYYDGATTVMAYNSSAFTDQEREASI